MSCDQCGYHVYGTRSWWEQRGFLTCSCGGTVLPTKPEDLAYCGIIGPDDMSQAAWNAICRAEGWAITRNQGQAARMLHESVIGAPSKPQCSHPGCGKWTRAGATHCNDHQPAELAAIPF